MGLPNTEGVEVGKDYPPVKADWYQLVFKNSEEKSSANGSYTKLEFDFVDDNRKAWGNLSHLDSALWKVKQFKLAIGMGDKENNLTQYYGTRLTAYVQDHEYQGKHYPEVVEYKALDSESGLPF